MTMHCISMSRRSFFLRSLVGLVVTSLFGVDVVSADADLRVAGQARKGKLLPRRN